MFSSLDLLSRNKEVYSVWHTGISNASLSKEQVFNTDLKKIAQDIIENDENMAFRLSAIVMKGAVVIYSKQTLYVLTDCTDTITKISLTYKGKEQENEKTEGNKQNTTRDKHGIDDATMAIWDQAQNFDQETNQFNFTRSEVSQKESIEGSNSFPETEIRQENSESDEIEPANDLGDEIHFDFIDDDKKKSDEDLNVAIPSSDIDEEVPIPNDNEISESDQEEDNKKRSNRLIIDTKPLMSLNLFMERLKESIEVSRQRSRKVNMPKNGILVIADEIDHLFHESYDERENYIGYQYKNLQTDPYSPALPFDSESDYGIGPLDDQNESENDIEEGNSSLLEFLPEIQEALKEKETVSFNELTASFDLQQIAKAFYTTLALCNEGKINLIQETPEDMIYITSN